MARSRLVRSPPSSRATSPASSARGNRCGVRTRNLERGAGRLLVCASSPDRSAGANHDEDLPFGIGDARPGSLITRYSYRPATAASRRLIEAGASRSVRLPFRSSTFGPGRPATVSCRHADRKSSTSHVLTASTFNPHESSHRANASSPYP